MYVHFKEPLHLALHPSPEAAHMHKLQQDSSPCGSTWAWMADGCREIKSASGGVTIDAPARDCTKACGVDGQGPAGIDR